MITTFALVRNLSTGTEHGSSYRSITCIVGSDSETKINGVRTVPGIGKLPLYRRVCALYGSPEPSKVLVPKVVGCSCCGFSNPAHFRHFRHL